MVDKNKQRERIKKEFINAAKEIIQQEGIEKVSARKIGEISGYSYATIYNYFSDINMLLVETSLEYLDDCYEFMVHKLDLNDSTFNQILQLSKDYVTYMVDHPDIFKIVFVNEYGPHVQEVAKNYVPKVAILLNQKLMEIDESLFHCDREITQQLLSSSIHGKILFLINGRGNVTVDEVHHQMEAELTALIGRN